MASLGSLLMEAVTIMCTGMIVVFAFLSVLIFCVRLLEKIAPKDPAPAVASPRPATPVNNTSGIQPEVVAAISVAVHQYRKQHA